MQYTCLPNELTKCSNSDYHNATITFELWQHFCIVANTKRYTGSQADSIATSHAPCYHTFETNHIVELMGPMEINTGFSCYYFIFDSEIPTVRDIHIWEGTIEEVDAVKSLPTQFPQGTFLENIFARILLSWTSLARIGTLADMNTM